MKAEKVEQYLEGCRGRAWPAHYLGYFECFAGQMYYEAHDVLDLLDRERADFLHAAGTSVDRHGLEDTANRDGGRTFGPALRNSRGVHIERDVLNPLVIEHVRNQLPGTAKADDHDMAANRTKRFFIVQRRPRRPRGHPAS